ncbi:hypothetical protein EYF80_061254 [Liparis tanakae]|uniref:Uncharacterized protein n=1 Tax=Liparis tanakae TaxID=230148 RepID=A0A4Z2EIL8_9TELE|nr:hypothetical protein EYF80_061254 [Liparis tanakae]
MAECEGFPSSRTARQQINTFNQMEENHAEVNKIIFPRWRDGVRFSADKASDFEVDASRCWEDIAAPPADTLMPLPERKYEPVERSGFDPLSLTGVFVSCRGVDANQAGKGNFEASAVSPLSSLRCPTPSRERAKSEARQSATWQPERRPHKSN